MAIEAIKKHKLKQQEEKLFAGNDYKDEDLVFANPLGGKLDVKYLYKNHCRVLKKAGIPHISFHELRHTYATFSRLAGATAKATQGQLGHASSEQTDDYTHVLHEMKVYAANKLEDFYRRLLYHDYD